METYTLIPQVWKIEEGATHKTSIPTKRITSNLPFEHVHYFQTNIAQHKPNGLLIFVRIELK